MSNGLAEPSGEIVPTSETSRCNGQDIEGTRSMLARIERPVPSAMTSDFRERSQRSISTPPSAATPATPVSGEPSEGATSQCSSSKRSRSRAARSMQVLIGWFILKLIRPSLRQSETRRWAAGREMFRICAISSCVRPAM